ncbi:MAG: PqqD family protein [Gammaproteobacteria bacterium]
MKLARYTKFREEKFGGVLFETRSEKGLHAQSDGCRPCARIRAGDCDEQLIIERLKARFDAAEGAIERAAAEFIASLRQQGLVEN